MKPSQPTSFVIKKRDTCASCTNIPPCPACPAGQQCQQIFRSSCQDCPVNKCVPIPGYVAPSSNKGALGGGLAALFIAALAAAFGYWFWRKLQAKRRRIALHEDAMERREKIRTEKEATTLQLGGAKGATAEDDDDTEYTQVTGVLNSGSSAEGQDGLGSLVEPKLFRRRSFGAATHLSRITEGAEEEEEAEEARKRNTMSSARSLTSGAGPRISIGSGNTSLGSHNIIPIAFKPSSSPASAPANTDRFSDAYQPALPSTAHRATGAPAIQVNVAPKGPVRPTRAPDLNLRLPETQKHQPAKSSPLASTVESQPAYEFMSIDPVETLNTSLPYSRSDRHLSTGTVNTIGSTHSGSLAYVLSAPQVITPVSGDGARRVQLGNGGKAQLVKVPSVNRKGRSLDTAAAREDPFSDQNESEDLIPPPTNRFGGGGDRSSAHSTSTLGIPFGENPFGPGRPLDQTSPSDAEESRSSWLGGEVSPSSPVRREEDPFKDPAQQEGRSSEASGEVSRASIGGLSLLGQFPFDFGSPKKEDRTPLPENALRKVGEFKSP